MCFRLAQRWFWDGWYTNFIQVRMDLTTIVVRTQLLMFTITEAIRRKLPTNHDNRRTYCCNLSMEPFTNTCKGGGWCKKSYRIFFPWKLRVNLIEKHVYSIFTGKFVVFFSRPLTMVNNFKGPPFYIRTPLTSVVVPYQLMGFLEEGSDNDDVIVGTYVCFGFSIH